MGRQWNTIIESLGPLSGGTGLSINANLTELEALVTTIQADLVDGVSPIRGTTTTGTLTAGTTNGTLFATNSTRNYLLVQCTSGTVFIDTNGTAVATDNIQLTAGQGITFEGSFVPTGAIAAITSTGTARVIGVQG
jgi:ferric-dicitrate binding protein FerR (iron transport regulator)